MATAQQDEEFAAYEASRKARGLPVTWADWKRVYGEHGFTPPSMTMERGPRDVHLIYFLKSGDLLKVGLTHNIQQRMKSLRLGAPRGLVLRGTREVPAFLSRQTEKQIHLALKDHAVGREWFAIEAPAARALAQPIVERAWRCLDAVLASEYAWPLYG